jgi:tellurite resistance-related uncharacterized protein
MTENGRNKRLGTDIECPLCDRAELPPDLRIVRTAGPFDNATLPAGLRRRHQIADQTWGVLRVVEGTIGFRMETEPPVDVQLEKGDRQPIPPRVSHQLALEGPAVVGIDFFVAP